MSNKPVKGSCLCERVAYEIIDNLGIFQYCHCSRCRKFTGSAFASNIFVRPEHFRWLKGEEFVGGYELPDARYFGTSFCTCCGSSLPWTSRGGRSIIVPAGTLDQDPGIRPQQNIFCASRASWYTAPGELVEHDALPPRG